MRNANKYNNASIRNLARNNIEYQQARQHYNSKNLLNFNLEPNDYVSVRNNTPRIGFSKKLLPKYIGVPYLIAICVMIISDHWMTLLASS